MRLAAAQAARRGWFGPRIKSEGDGAVIWKARGGGLTRNSQLSPLLLTQRLAAPESIQIDTVGNDADLVLQVRIITREQPPLRSREANIVVVQVKIETQGLAQPEFAAVLMRNRLGDLLLPQKRGRTCPRLVKKRPQKYNIKVVKVLK